VDQVTLELRNIKVRKRGTVRKVVTLGQYDLHLTVNRVTGKLETAGPRSDSGGTRLRSPCP